VSAPTVALAVADALRDPRFQATLTRLAHTAAPPGAADQMAAAAAHSLQLTAAAFASDGAHHREVDVEDVPEWLWLPLVAEVLGLVAGTGRTCVHACPHRPAPYFAAAWRPGLVVCHTCLHLLHLRPGSAADRRCDRCGHVCAGPQLGDGIHPGTIHYGPLAYTYGLCGPCHRELHPAGGDRRG
jgi:hypothetical protein